MPTNIQLNSKSGYYELVADNWQTTFCLEQISLLKMHKKYNYESIFMYLLFFIVSCLLLTQIFTTPVLFILFLFLYTFFWFKAFIYTPIYEINMIIDSELFSFTTKNKDIYQDFLLLQHFYRNEE
jgi:hypothetical protein